MIMEIISFVQDILHSYVRDSGTPNAEQEQELHNQILLIELDHMRDVKGYTAILAKWAKQLDLFGRLIFRPQSSKGVLILLLGQESRIRDFEKRLRTSKVDVDSQGRPCKEKMLKVLCSEHWEESGEGGIPDEKDFQVCETVDDLELKRLFCSVPKLAEVFEKHVKKLKTS